MTENTRSLLVVKGQSIRPVKSFVDVKIKGIILSKKPLMAKIKRTNFRIDDEIERRALLEAGE